MPNIVEQQPLGQDLGLRQNDEQTSRILNRLTAKNNLSLPVRAYSTASATIDLDAGMAVANTGCSTLILPLSTTWGNNTFNPMKTPFIGIVNNTANFLTLSTTSPDTLNQGANITIQPLSTVWVAVYNQGAWVTVGAQGSFGSKASVFASGSWTPVMFGFTTSGVGTYTIQQGLWTQQGNIVSYSCLVQWSAHTGTGQMLITTPPSPAPPFNINTNIFFPGTVVCVGMAVPAGAHDVALLINNGRMDIYQESAGNLGAQNILASGTIRVNGIYQL